MLIDNPTVFMFRLVGLLLLLVIKVSSSDLLLPRYLTMSSVCTNSTITKAPSPISTPLCCYLNARAVTRVQWYTGSFDYTIAVVSTIVYQYKDGSTTAYKTVFANSSLPTGLFEGRQEEFKGLPTAIVQSGGPYLALTTLISGNAFTDPYGTVYPSPTPVLYYSHGGVSYHTESALTTGNSYACPSAKVSFGFNALLDVYPLGFFEVDTAVVRGNYTGEFDNPMSPNLVKWLISHVPPNPRPVWSNLASCTPGFSNGIPVAHVPVNALTGRVLTTIKIESTLYPTPGLVTEPPAPQPTAQPPTNNPSPTPDKSPQPPIYTPSPPPNTPQSSTPSTSLPLQIENPPSPSPQPQPSSLAPPPANQIPSNPTPSSPTPTINLPPPSTPSTPVTSQLPTLTQGGTLTIPGLGTSPPTTYILPASSTGIIIINGVTSALPSSPPQTLSGSSSTTRTLEIAGIIVSMGGFRSSSSSALSGSAIPTSSSRDSGGNGRGSSNGTSTSTQTSNNGAGGGGGGNTTVPFISGAVSGILRGSEILTLLLGGLLLSCLVL